MMQPTPKECEAENVRVVVRVRPLSDKEKAAGHYEITKVDTVNGSINVVNPHAHKEEPPKGFTFDLVYDTDSRQLDIYNETARPIVDKVLQGYNGTILAYGQTGTGKTFTMEGDCAAPELRGIIPNSFAHIFGHIAKAAEQTKFLVHVQYVEIYNEEVRDLLSRDQSVRLEVKERPDFGVYIQDISGYVCDNADDMERVMTIGNKNRKVGSTAMNETSSRSHAIFTITIENEHIGQDGKPHYKMGKLHLVDLAGSERQSKTGATDIRLKEAIKINLSLSTLGNVISALVDGKSTHIPYRNSKLTRLLQDSLGGNSKTVMCANIGPANYNYEETITTLRYANRAKNITNRARVNEDPKDTLLRQFQAEIEELRRQLEDMPAVVQSEEDAEFAQAFKANIMPISLLDQAIDEEQQLNSLHPEDSGPVDDKHEVEIKNSETEHLALRDKLQKLQKKILIGGENLLEKAEVQEKLLEDSARELELRREKEDQLRHALKAKEAEIVDIEERYSSLQEEATGKTKKLKKVFALYLSANAELNDMQHEQQREMEGLLDSIRGLSRELKQQEKIIQSFIPGQYQEKLEESMHWNEDIGEWQLKCVAYTGNNMRKTQPHLSAGHNKEYKQPDLSNVYLAYTSDRTTNSLRSARSRAGRSASQRAPSGAQTDGKS